jgi:hypothetical protein
LQSLPDCRVLIFDGSEAWLYGYSKIPVFEIHEYDIITTHTKSIDEIEKYAFNNWQLVKLALDNHQDLLFRLKTRKPSKRGFAVRTIINYLDEQQRSQRETAPNNQPKLNIAYILEEAQDIFNIRSTQRSDSEEFLSVFNEGRNNKEAFFTASQRLNDFSKTIRTKQNYVLGNISIEDKTPALKQLEKLYSVNLSKLAL